LSYITKLSALQILVPRSRIISSRCCGTAFVGFPSSSASSSSCVCWHTRLCMDWHRRTSPTTVDQSQPPGINCRCTYEHGSQLARSRRH